MEIQGCESQPESPSHNPATKLFELPGRAEQEARLTERLRGRAGRRRNAAAALTALAVHIALLGVMGLSVPRPPALPPIEEGPVEQITLVPAAGIGGAAPRSLSPRRARRQRTPPSPLAGLAAPPRPVAVPSPAPAPVARGPDFPGFFVGGLPGCGREDLDLLTTDERVRCRDVIQNERDRRARAAADATRSERLKDAMAHPVDGIAPEKRSYYDAVQAAKAKVRGGDASAFEEVKSRRVGIGRDQVGQNIGIHCHIAIGPGARNDAPCKVKPPPGFLTEEARIAPP